MSCISVLMGLSAHSSVTNPGRSCRATRRRTPGRLGLAAHADRMGAASHLGIDLREYDARIRTFIPGYEQLLEVADALVAARAPPPPADRRSRHRHRRAGRPCLEARARRRASSASTRTRGCWLPPGSVCGAEFSGDPGQLRNASICRTATPSPRAWRCTTSRRRPGGCGCSAASTGRLRPGGVLVIADCYLGVAIPRLRGRRSRRVDRAPRAPLLRRTQAAGYLRAWAKEDITCRCR